MKPKNKISTTPLEKKINSSKFKKIILGLIGTIGLTATVVLITKLLKKNKSKKIHSSYDLVMENIEDLIKKDKSQKDISLRILKYQYGLSKLSNLDNMNIDNVCKFNEHFEEHVKNSCKYSKNIDDCIKKAFGRDIESINKSLRKLGCL